jgi:hypothetical protein
MLLSRYYLVLFSCYPGILCVYSPSVMARYSLLLFSCCVKVFFVLFSCCQDILCFVLLLFIFFASVLLFSCWQYIPSFCSLASIRYSLLLFSCCPYSLHLFFCFPAGKAFHTYVILLQSGILCCCSPAVHILCFCSSVFLLARHSILLLSCFNPVFFASVLLLSRYSLLLLLCFPAFKSFLASILLLLKYIFFALLFCCQDISCFCLSPVKLLFGSVVFFASVLVLSSNSLLLLSCCKIFFASILLMSRYSLHLFYCCQRILCLCSPYINILILSVLLLPRYSIILFPSFRGILFFFNCLFN